MDYVHQKLLDKIDSLIEENEGLRKFNSSLEGELKSVKEHASGGATYFPSYSLSSIPKHWKQEYYVDPFTMSKGIV